LKKRANQRKTGIGYPDFEPGNEFFLLQITMIITRTRGRPPCVIFRHILFLDVVCLSYLVRRL